MTQKASTSRASGRSGTFNSICRGCGNRCSIVVEVQDGRPVQVSGDPDAGPYRGYSCRRGRALPDLYNDSKRLLRPVKRLPDGTFQEISTEQALDEIAEIMRGLLDRYGPRSLAMYIGTQAAQSAPVFPLSRSLFDALGSPMIFSANTIDQPGKQVAAGLHGYWMAPAQGFFEAETAIWIGVNPLVTYKGVPTGAPLDGVRAIHARGGTTVVIDPRRTETAKVASLHLQLKPGEDVTVLAGLIHLILREDLHDKAFIAENVDGFEALAAAVAPFTPDYVARRAEIRAEDLVTAARWFGQARRGYAVAGTGVAMTRARGTLTEYLVLCLDTICGHYMRTGEVYPAPSPLAPAPNFKAQAWPPVQAFDFGERLKSTGRADSLGGLQVADLPDEILYEGEGRVRALFNIGGNPVVAWPDQARTIRAMDALDLLVSFDVTMSQTARRSSYVFASTMSLETPAYQTSSSATVGYANAHMGYLGPWAQYTPVVADRPEGSDLIEEWEVFFELGRRLGLELSWVAPGIIQTGPPKPAGPFPKFDMSRRPTHDEILELWTKSARVPLAEVKARPGGGYFPPDEHVRVGPKDEGWRGRLSVGDTHMMRDLAQVAAEPSPGAAPGELRLLNRRGVQINSSFNIGAINRGRFDNPLFVNPADLAALGLETGDQVEVASEVGAIRAIVEADETVRPGSASMSHCFGDAPGEDDLQTKGSSVNRLLSVGFARDAYSGQPIMANVAVQIRRVTATGTLSDQSSVKEG
jgi:anaerobic selenocysteine-containing dehydrogenase